MSQFSHRVAHSPVKNMRPSHSISLLCFVMAVFMYSTVGTMTQGVARPVPPATPADRLFIAVFQLGEEFETLYQTEDKRVLEACKSYIPECFSKRFAPVRRMVGVLRSANDATSPVIANVHAVLKASGEKNRGLAFGLDIEWTSKPRQFESWISDVGDWENGIHVEGVRPRGKWVQLTGRPFPTPVWISTEGAAFEAYVLTLEGEILKLQPLTARRPDRTAGLTTPGNFVILSVKGSEIEFRQEVASDVPCGKSVPLPDVMPPTLRATAGDFFNKDGSPRFSAAYTKSC